MSTVSVATAVQQITALKTEADRPIFIAISGYGGSGKSTLAKEISSKLPGSTVIPIDDFIIGARNERSKDWATFDRARLTTDILVPAQIGKNLRYKVYNSGDFVAGRGGKWREVTIGQFIIVEGCSMVHPALLPHFDYTIWIDCPQELALKSAKARDQLETKLFAGENTDKLWDKVWGPNDRDFFETFRPDQLATVRIKSYLTETRHTV